MKKVNVMKKVVSMAALAAAFMAASVLANAVDAVAQSAEFKCPPPGTVVEFSDGRKTIWVSQDGNTCRIRSNWQTGEELDLIWYAPAAANLVSASNAWAQQVKPSNWWPLAVGKKTQARYDGPSSNGSYSGSWITTLTVEEAEKITTEAGTFDTFVVVYQVEAFQKKKFRSTLRQWYAPEPGVTVKIDYSDNRGQKRSLEATVIRRSLS
jgi:hypothetical protein